MCHPVFVSNHCFLVTFFDAYISAGFPSPAADHIEKKIDLNEHLMLNKDASFIFRVRGKSMLGIGIYPGDTVIVDRSITPRHNHIVLAVVDGEYTIKRLSVQKGVVRLIAENPDFGPIELEKEQTLSIWGVVTKNLRCLLNY